MDKSKLFWFVLVAVSWLSGNAQECNFLDSRNGFRTIKLGSKVSDYPDFSRQDADNKSLFTKYGLDSDYVYLGKESDKILNAQILYIFVKAKEGTITEISVITHKMVGIGAILTQAYGEPDSKMGPTTIWKGNEVQCTLWGDDSPFPGCRILYKPVLDAYRQLQQMKKEQAAKAQKDL